MSNLRRGLLMANVVKGGSNLPKVLKDACAEYGIPEANMADAYAADEDIVKSFDGSERYVQCDGNCYFNSGYVVDTTKLVEISYYTQLLLMSTLQIEGFSTRGGHYYYQNKDTYNIRTSNGMVCSGSEKPTIVITFNHSTDGNIKGDVAIASPFRCTQDPYFIFRNNSLNNDRYMRDKRRWVIIKEDGICVRFLIPFMKDGVTPCMLDLMDSEDTRYHLKQGTGNMTIGI